MPEDRLSYQKLFFICFLLSSTFRINGQSSYSSDTSRINFLNKKSFELRDKKPDSCVALAILAIQLSQKINYLPGLGDGYTRLGIVEKNKGNYDSAVILYKKSLFFRSQIGDPDLMGRVYSNIGVAYTFQAQYDSAVHYLIKSLHIAEQLGQKPFEADRLMNLGIVYKKNEDYDLALDYYGKALLIYRELHNNNGEMQCYVNIGSLLYAKKSYRESVEPSREGLDKARNLKDTKNQLLALGNLALAYEKLEKLDSAIYYTHEVIAKQKTDQNNRRSMAVDLSNLGIMFGEKKMNDSAVFYLEESQQLALEVGDLKLIAENYQNLATIDSSRHNFNRAYQYQKEFIIYHDSVFNESKANAIAEMQTKYETEKKDQQIVLMKKDEEIKTQQLSKQKLLKNGFLILSVLIIALGLVLFNRFQLRKRLEKTQAIMDERRRISSDMHDDLGSGLSKIALLTQVLKTSASDLRGRSELDKISESAQEALEKMSEIVWSLNPRNDTLANLAAYIRKYAVEFFENSTINCTVHLPPKIPLVNIKGEQRRNVFLVVKEALHNILKHSRAANAELIFDLSDKNFKITIHDNGTGFSHEQNSFGNGLLNMQRRMQESRGTFNIINDGGTTVYLSVPIT